MGARDDDEVDDKSSGQVTGRQSGWTGGLMILTQRGKVLVQERKSGGQLDIVLHYKYSGLMANL